MKHLDEAIYESMLLNEDDICQKMESECNYIIKVANSIRSISQLRAAYRMRNNFTTRWTKIARNKDLLAKIAEYKAQIDAKLELKSKLLKFKLK